MATPVTHRHTPDYRTEFPRSIDLTTENKTKDQDPTPYWNSGSDTKAPSLHRADQTSMISINPVQIKIDSSARDLSINLINSLADLDSARSAAAQVNMNNQASTSVNADDTQDATALGHGCETSYINGCIAGR